MHQHRHEVMSVRYGSELVMHCTTEGCVWRLHMYDAHHGSEREQAAYQAGEVHASQEHPRGR